MHPGRGKRSRHMDTPQFIESGDLPPARNFFEFIARTQRYINRMPPDHQSFGFCRSHRLTARKTETPAARKQRGRRKRKPSYLANTSFAVCDFTRAAALACTTPLRTALSLAAT